MDTTIALRLLSTFLPTSLFEYVNKHALRPDAPLHIYFTQIRAQATRAADKAYPYVQPRVERLVNTMATATESSPAVSAVSSFLVPLAILTVAMLLLNWIRRMVMWWTRLAFRAVYWATIAALVAWVYNRGVGESVKDLVVVGSKVAGYLTVVKDIWMEEYERYEGQQSNLGRGKGRGYSR